MKPIVVAHDTFGQMDSMVIPAALTLESLAAMLESVLQNIDQDLKDNFALEDAVAIQGLRS